MESDDLWDLAQSFTKVDVFRPTCPDTIVTSPVFSAASCTPFPRSNSPIFARHYICHQACERHSDRHTRLAVSFHNTPIDCPHLLQPSTWCLSNTACFHIPAGNIVYHGNVSEQYFRIAFMHGIWQQWICACFSQDCITFHRFRISAQGIHTFLSCPSFAKSKIGWDGMACVCVEEWDGSRWK